MRLLLVLALAFVPLSAQATTTWTPIERFVRASMTGSGVIPSAEDQASTLGSEPFSEDALVGWSGIVPSGAYISTGARATQISAFSDEVLTLTTDVVSGGSGDTGYGSRLSAESFLSVMFTLDAGIFFDLRGDYEMTLWNSDNLRLAVMLDGPSSRIVDFLTVEHGSGSLDLGGFLQPGDYVFTVQAETNGGVYEDFGFAFPPWVQLTGLRLSLVPEPSTGSMLAAGLAVLAARSRRS